MLADVAELAAKRAERAAKRPPGHGPPSVRLLATASITRHSRRGRSERAAEQARIEAAGAAEAIAGLKSAEQDAQYALRQCPKQSQSGGR